jgi:hypothetical protein
MKTLRRLGLAALLALVSTALVVPSASAASYLCGTSGGFTVDSGLVSGGRSCAGSLVIPDTASAIDDSAFFGANQITSIVMPDSVLSIGNKAFFGATKITQVTFGSSLASIGEGAFFGNRLLSSLTFNGDAPSVGLNSFYGVNAGTVYILSGKQGFGATTWNGFPTVVRIFNVTLDSQGGTAVQPISASSMTSSPDTERSSFSFLGWFDQATGGTQIGFPYNVGSDVTLFAQWIESSATPAVPAVAAPYSGPIPTKYSDKTPSIGDEVTISGLRLNLVTSCTIDGVTAVMSNQSADSFNIVIPIGITSGLKDLVMAGPAGKLTAQGALTIQESIPEIIMEASLPSKVNSGSFNRSIVVYAKGLNGKTLSWKFAGKWFKTTITSDYQVFNRKTAAVGLDVDVHLYIDGEKQLAKKITTR